MKRILIVGAGSYIGESVRKYLSKHSDKYEVDVLETRGLKPDRKQIDGFDVVFHVAGIAHIKETKKNSHLYYEVNRDLTIDVAKCAKSAGVRQFILMSTMAVYGMEEGVVKKETKPKPRSHYGRSKLEADRAVWKMRDGSFKVAILRAPMIYGSGCKGNYQKLRWLALHMPVFPKVDNERSMLFIGNLCAYVKDVIDRGESGVFFPQNKEYVCTSEMVQRIAVLNEKKIRFVDGFGFLFKHVPLQVIKKAFGSLVYERTEPVGAYSFKKSMEETERLFMKPLVSITTATYNSEKTLAKTIESVLNQTYGNIEYIIIDGLSKDGTLQIAEGYREKFERKGISYRIISESDLGMYDAINKGIRVARGEIVGNINSDDWYEPDAVEKVVRKYNETQFDFMYGNLKVVFPNGRIKIKKAGRPAYITSRHWNHPTQFARRELYLKEPYKLESMYDDFDLFLRVTRKGYHIEIIKEPLANFTMEGMSHRRSVRDAVERGKVRYRIYRNNGYSKFYLLECFCAEMLKLVLG